MTPELSRAAGMFCDDDDLRSSSGFHFIVTVTDLVAGSDNIGRSSWSISDVGVIGRLREAISNEHGMLNSKVIYYTFVQLF